MNLLTPGDANAALRAALGDIGTVVIRSACARRGSARLGLSEFELCATVSSVDSASDAPVVSLPGVSPYSTVTPAGQATATRRAPGGEGRRELRHGKRERETGTDAMT